MLYYCYTTKTAYISNIATTKNTQTSTHTFKVADRVSLPIDILKPLNAPENDITLIHFHGEFLTSFSPHWLVNIFHARGWTYTTASYHLLPEPTGFGILSDARDAVRWIHKNISQRIIIAGSTAGGYLALGTASHPEGPRPLAVLSVYGMLGPTHRKYITEGTALRSPITDLPVALNEIDTAVSSGRAIDGYTFPTSPPTDLRFRWVNALHQAAKYPDILTRHLGLSRKMSTKIFHRLFSCMVMMMYWSGIIRVFQQLELRPLIDVHLEIAKGHGHGFEAKNVIGIDAKDIEGEDVEFKGYLQRVIKALEKAVNKNFQRI